MDAEKHPMQSYMRITVQNDDMTLNNFSSFDNTGAFMISRYDIFILVIRLITLFNTHCRCSAQSVYKVPFIQYLRNIRISESKQILSQMQLCMHVYLSHAIL